VSHVKCGQCTPSLWSLEGCKWWGHHWLKLLRLHINKLKVHMFYIRSTHYMFEQTLPHMSFVSSHLQNYLHGLRKGEQAHEVLGWSKKLIGNQTKIFSKSTITSPHHFWFIEYKRWSYTCFGVGAQKDLATDLEGISEPMSTCWKAYRV
jgi:hypothetical protein